MRLVGFNAGTIQEQVIDGEIVRTAYVKTPRPEPWVITPTGAAGDQVAVHTDHLYAFDRESYEYWAAELGASRADWADGHFAENLTVDALDQTQLRVGDRYRVGSAVVVVAGPRVPCWKLTWRLGQPKTFMRRFRLSGRSGAYFGVVEPGIVAPGDQFVPLDVDLDAPSVAVLSRLCDSSARITPEDLAVIDRALACPELSETVRSTLTLKLGNLDDGEGTGWKGWRRFEIDEAVPETPDITSYTLRPVDAGTLPPFRAGQHVVVRVANANGMPIVRTWSLSDHAAEPDRYRITVKLRLDGHGSPALAAASTVELRSPAGSFHLDRGSFRPVVLVAAGIGITPLMAMIHSHLSRDEPRPPLWLLYGTPGPDRTAFRHHLDDVFGGHHDVHLHFFYTRPGADASSAPVGTVHEGRISADRVVDVMRGNYLPTSSGPAAIPWFESDIYLCGPIAFNDAVRAGLVAAGANPDLVFVEDIAAASAPTLPVRTADAEVEYGGRGLTAHWVAAEERTLLELAEDQGLDLPYDCRAGTCRTCESRLVCGEVDGPVSVMQDGTRRVLLCTSYPRSDRVVVEPPVE